MTGPEFATAHGDSSTWSPADYEAQQNLAANDLHTAWRALHPASVDYDAPTSRPTAA